MAWRQLAHGVALQAGWRWCGWPALCVGVWVDVRRRLAHASVLPRCRAPACAWARPHSCLRALPRPRSHHAAAPRLGGHAAAALLVSPGLPVVQPHAGGWAGCGPGAHTGPLCRPPAAALPLACKGPRCASCSDRRWDRSHQPAASVSAPHAMPLRSSPPPPNHAGPGPHSGGAAHAGARAQRG